MMKTALFTVAALVGLALCGTTAEAQSRHTQGRDSHGPRATGSHDSHSSPIQLAGHGHRGSHGSHYHRSHSNYGHYPSYHHGHGYSNRSYHRGHGYHGGYGQRGYHSGHHRYNPGYRSSGIGVSGRNFSLYFGF
jgi:Ni/Co efflux regulator RcnB